MSRALALVDSSDASREYDNASVANALLETKVHVPRSSSGLVPRRRLLDALHEGAARQLTVVVAPAGFGKTSLLAAWLGEEPHAAPIGWVSLDPTDNEPAVFWAYAIKALQRIHPAAGLKAMAVLRSSHVPAAEALLTTFINEIDAIDADFTLVLDDYHVIDAAPIHAALTFLLDHLPPRMHVVVASRSDPPLPLHRLRARGELSEVRAEALRFTLDETTAFLHDVMALDLSASDTMKLERRTEGWIAGLKLAALSLKGRSDIRGFVDGFSGDNRYIADYLVGEVLESEPARIRHFLEATSILDRMNVALCDAVTGEPGSQAVLDDLECRNLFVVALDDRREWYRYHHLFADVLQKQSARRDPVAARIFHGRASAWYERHGSPADAVRHALAAQDLDLVADLLERNWPEKDRSYESRLWLTRVKTLPDAIVRARPLLSMGYAWGLLNSGELEAVEPRLQDVERWLETADPGDDARVRSLSSEVAAARVYLAQARGEAADTVEQAKRALELTPEGEETARVTAVALLGLARWARGDLDAAYSTFSDALVGMRASGHELDAVRGTFVLGDIRAAQGRLHDAARIYEGGLNAAREAAPLGPAETDELHLGLSELHCEWNDLASATRYLDTIAQSARQMPHAGNKMRWCTAMARVSEARGDLDAALALLHDAATHERRDPVPRLRPVEALKARIRIAQGRLGDAVDWASKAKLSVDDDLSYLREFEHITLARILIARHAADGDQRLLNDGVRLLERLQTAARTGGRIGSVIEVLALEALAQLALGNLRGAMDLVAQALILAEREKYLRVFLDEGTRMRDLLRHVTARGLAGEYTRRVLVSFDAPKQPVVLPTDAIAMGLVEPLTAREHEILRLIAAGLRNQDIADHLAISAATVKRHIANAYGKLGVGHRTEALVRAAELKLL